jgi:hypothetical protein
MIHTACASLPCLPADSASLLQIQLTLQGVYKAGNGNLCNKDDKPCKVAQFAVSTHPSSNGSSMGWLPQQQCCAVRWGISCLHCMTTVMLLGAAWPLMHVAWRGLLHCRLRLPKAAMACLLYLLRQLMSIPTPLLRGGGSTTAAKPKQRLYQGCNPLALTTPCPIPVIKPLGLSH